MDFEPRRWSPPPDPGLAGAYEANDRLAGAALWDAGGAGPEDVAIDGDGRVWTGLEDGRIVRFEADGGGRRVVADTGGRPLGIEIDPAGGVVVCDAARGLLRLSPAGELAVLVDSFAGEPLRFTNNAAVAADGTVYFTDSSRRFGIERYKLDLLEHSGTGRLLARLPSGEVELLLDGLFFANGVALGPEEDFLVFAETGTYSISRLWLAGPRRGEREVLLANLPGFPDNLSRHGEIYWAAFPSPRNRLLDRLLPRTLPRHLVARLPEALQPQAARHGLVLGFDADGRVRHNLQDPSGRVAICTGVRQLGERLFIGSLSEPTIAVLELSA